MPLDWTALRDQMNFTQRLVLFASRWDILKEEQQRITLLSVRRKAYNDELTLQARNVGCEGHAGHLTNADITSKLNDDSDRDAKSISNTFNYYLAVEIIRVGTTNPRAGLLAYTRAVRAWMPTYWAWKIPQITQFADLSARAMAQQDFYRINGGILGTAKLEPRNAVCPVCQGFIDRGAVPLRVALSFPPPYHVNCFPPDSLVNMPDGTVKAISEIQAGEFVASRHDKTQVIRVLGRYTQEDLYRLSVGGQVLRLTGDHPVLTARGWILARDLQADDLVAFAHYREQDAYGK